MRSQVLLASSWSWVTKMVVRPSLRCKAQQFAAHLHAQAGVKVRQRLVQQQHLRLRSPRCGPARSAVAGRRKLVRHPVGKMLQADRSSASSTRRPISDAGSLRTFRAGRRRRFAHRQMRPQRMGLETPCPRCASTAGRRHPPARRRGSPRRARPEARIEPQQRGFSRPRRAEKGEELARLDRQVHAGPAPGWGQRRGAGFDLDSDHFGFMAKFIG